MILSQFKQEQAQEEPRLSERDFKALQTTRKRGETLTADGYTFSPNQNRPGIYEAMSPIRNRRDGSTYHTYHTLDAYGGTCDCVAFSRFGECKHLIGLGKALQKAFEELNAALRFVGPLVYSPALEPFHLPQVESVKAERRSSAPVHVPSSGFSSHEAFVSARSKDFD